MSQNDLIHLESNFKSWSEERARGLKGIDPFVYYCVDHFLKHFDLSDEEILYGIVDGANDGGVDAIYFLINRGELVREDSEIDPKGTTKAHLIIMQVKTGDGFKMTEIDKLPLFTDDLLDLARPVAPLATKYHPHLIEIMRTFKEKYLLIAGGFPTVAIDYYYITKGDETVPDTKAVEAADRVKQKVKVHLNKAQCNFHFVNAQTLLEQVQRRPARERTLVWAEAPMQTQEGYVGLVKLRDYFSFITDEDGDLADRIFESNVRGFQHETLVNMQIRQSLHSAGKPNFWLLNNGITIIATRLQSAGHLQLNVEDPQIVNGLQTSREIFSYFVEDKPQAEERAILVKVIQTTDEEVRDATIKATNSQNKMHPASLRATDPIHRQLEEFFKQYDLYYDRRKGFYKDKGKPIEKIVSVTELVQAVVSIVLQRPDDARARPGDYIKDETRYQSVFGGNGNLPLGVYLTCLQIMRRVEAFLDLQGLEKGNIRNIKFYVADYLVARLLRETELSPEQVLTINASSIEDAVLRDSYERVRAMYEKLGANDTVARGPELLKRLKTQIRQRRSKARKAE